MLKGIPACQNTARPHDLNLRLEALVKGMNIGQSCRFDILTAITRRLSTWFS